MKSVHMHYRYICIYICVCVYINFYFVFLYCPFSKSPSLFFILTIITVCNNIISRRGINKSHILSYLTKYLLQFVKFVSKVQQTGKMFCLIRWCLHLIVKIMLIGFLCFLWVSFIVYTQHAESGSYGCRWETHSNVTVCLQENTWCRSAGPTLIFRWDSTYMSLN